MVINTTALKHPYKKNEVSLEVEEDEDNEVFLSNKNVFCPDCQKTVPTELTMSELKDSRREAKLRVLKLKKIACAKQYEAGMMSKEAKRFLQQAVDAAFDSETLTVDKNGLFKLFSAEVK